MLALLAAASFLHDLVSNFGNFAQAIDAEASIFLALWLCLFYVAGLIAKNRYKKSREEEEQSRNKAKHLHTEELEELERKAVTLQREMLEVSQKVQDRMAKNLSVYRQLLNRAIARETRLAPWVDKVIRLNHSDTPPLPELPEPIHTSEMFSYLEREEWT